MPVACSIILATPATKKKRPPMQIPFDPTVRVKLDTNICMIKENPEDGPSCTIAGRWYRDPSIPIHRTEITRFPHAVLELKLALASGETTPEWVQDLVESGMLTEIDMALRLCSPIWYKPCLTGWMMRAFGRQC